MIAKWTTSFPWRSYQASPCLYRQALSLPSSWHLKVMTLLRAPWVAKTSLSSVWQWCPPTTQQQRNWFQQEIPRNGTSVSFSALGMQHLSQYPLSIMALTTPLVIWLFYKKLHILGVKLYDNIPGLEDILTKFFVHFHLFIYFWRFILFS